MNEKPQDEITRPLDKIVMRDCPECLELLTLQNKHSVLLSEYWKNFPRWYREGEQCPSCGAGFIGEFGTRKIPAA